MMTPFNTRIAPSPSGYFHLGTARTAYFNWLAARASKGKFILRIDDTNTEKSKDEFIDVIHQAMDYMGLDFDLTFKQSDRQDRYNEVIDAMVGAGTAVKKDGAVFLNYDLQTKSFFDIAAKKDISVTKLDLDFIGNMVLRKSDGMPTYHFANVIDDIDHDINFIIRGNDHTNNTMKQIAIYDALSIMYTTPSIPQYAHIGLLCDLKTGKKLSKSDGAKSLLDFQAEGIDSDAMNNFLLRLGWGPKVDDATTSLLPRDRALELFLNDGNLRNQHSKVDFQKLASFDKKYKQLKRA